MTIDTSKPRDVTTKTRDGCKLLYSYCPATGEVLSICVTDALGRMTPTTDNDWADARKHLAECVG